MQLARLFADLLVDLGAERLFHIIPLVRTGGRYHGVTVADEGDVPQRAVERVSIVLGDGGDFADRRILFEHDLAVVIGEDLEWIAFADTKSAADLLGDDHSAEFIYSAYNASCSIIIGSLLNVSVPDVTCILSGLPIVRSAGQIMQAAAGAFWKKRASAENAPRKAWAVLHSLAFAAGQHGAAFIQQVVARQNAVCVFCARIGAVSTAPDDRHARVRAEHGGNVALRARPAQHQIIGSGVFGGKAQRDRAVHVQ